MTTHQIEQDERASALNIPGRMERLPPSRFVRICLLLISLGTFWDAYMLYSVGPLSSHFVSSTGQANLATRIPLALFLGTFVGAVLLGRLADRIGRGRAFTLNLLVLALGNLATVLSPVGDPMLVALFVAGIGTGAEIPLSVTYVQELVPSASRGRMSSLMLTFGFVGGTVGGLIAFWLTKATSLPISGFKLGLLIPMVGALVAIGLRLWVPESPRWLERVGRLDDAERVIVRIERAVMRERGLTSLPEPDAYPASRATRARPTWTLLGRRYLRRTLSAWIIEFATGFGSYGFTTFVPVILYERGYTLVHALGYTAAIQLAYPVGTYLSSFVTDRIQRKWGIALFFLLNMAAGLGFYVAGTVPLIIFFGFLTEMLIFMDGPLLHTYEAEIYPTDLRGRGAGISFSISRLGGFLAPLAASAILASAGGHGGGAYLIIMAAGSWLVCSVVAAVLAVNTTKVSLEELEVPSA